MCMCGCFARFRKNTITQTLSPDLAFCRERVYGPKLQDPFQAGLCKTLDTVLLRDPCNKVFLRDGETFTPFGKVPEQQQV